MASIDHLTIRVSDLEAALDLYRRVFELLEFSGGATEGEGFYEWNDFSISQADAEHPPTENLHIGFAAHSRDQIDAWWQTLTAAGYRDDGAPGLRPEYSSSYYGGFLRDHDNNSIEAAHHARTDPAKGVIDHLWVRVDDLEASKPFYTALAPPLGVDTHDRGDRLVLITSSGTVSFLADEPPTRNMHLAFGVDDQKMVDAFHRAGLEAGAPDNGAPGERARYHPGYYGAYLLDPDSNNIEAVCHNR